MSDSTTDTTTTEPTDSTTEPAEPTAPAAAEGAEPTTADESADDASRNANKEAARYRRQLRETEAERDQLRTQLDAVRRAEVDRLITAQGLEPAAVWANGAKLEELVTDDGTVDAKRVAAAVHATREAFGIRPGYPATGQGKRDALPAGNAFQAAFRPPR